MTNELRKELERQYDRSASLAQKEKDEQTTADKTEDNIEEFLVAPRSYKKEYVEMFKTLPPAMRKYLCERESEIERGFSRLNNELQHHRWIDDIYSSRAERLNRLGITKAQDWVELMAKVDDALDSNPQNTLQFLAENYGVSQKQGVDLSPLITKLDLLEEKFNHLFSNYNARNQDAEKIIESQKAKVASFAPKGKNRLSKDLSKLTTREVLELKLAEYDD